MARLLTRSLLCCLVYTGAQAEEVFTLEPITVQAPRWEADWLEPPAAISTADLGRQPGAQKLAVDEVLNRLPGIHVQNRHNAAQGARLSIRGFGARASFGIRGIRVLVDGIPLTLPDGHTELDGLDLGLAEQVELIRGPSSALYGNAAGGVVLVSTAEPPSEPYLQGELATGSHGYGKARLEAGGRQGVWGALGALDHTETDGYRRHSAAAEDRFYGKLLRDWDQGSLTTLLSVTERQADDPGALTEAQAQANPEQASARNLAFDGGEQAQQSRVGWVLRQALESDAEVRLRLFLGQRDFANRLPFEDGGQVAYERDFGGFGAQYLRHAELAGRPNRFTVGLDYEFQRDERRNYDNLMGRRGALGLDQREKVDAVGLFVENEWQPRDRWALTLGGRYDSVRLEAEDDFLADGDDSGRRTLEELSYMAGVSYALAPRHRLYANLGSAFETPSTGELANPSGGGFNPALDSQQALNRELGLKGEWPTLRYELAAFSIAIDDTLLPYELPGESGRSYYRNAGESRRNGLEAGASWEPARHWRFATAYTYADYQFESYRHGGTDYGGNSVPGIPRQTLFAEAALDTGSRYGRLELLAVDRMYADDANRERVDGYARLDLRVGLRRALGRLDGEVYAGINNLADTDYYDNVRINAFGGRYFEPAPGRHYYIGLRLGY